MPKDYDPDLGVLPSIALLQGIVRDRQYRMLEWPDGVIQVCDVQTAHAILQIYQVLNDANKVRIEKRIAESCAWFCRIVDFCFAKLLDRELKS